MSECLWWGSAGQGNKGEYGVGCIGEIRLKCWYDELDVVMPGVYKFRALMQEVLNGVVGNKVAITCRK